jgi:hypothetical protein
VVACMRKGKKPTRKTAKMKQDLRNKCRAHETRVAIMSLLTRAMPVN